MYRAYFWGNFYLSSIQQGIQAGHVIAEMSQSCADQPDFCQWAQEDKVMIVKNGGDADALNDIQCMFQLEAKGYSWSYFTESMGALNGCLTSVGIIVPDYIYEAKDSYALFGFDRDLFSLIKSSRMAI